MHEPHETPSTRQQRDREFQDAHFHDDEDDIPGDDLRSERPRRPVAKRNPLPKTPRRRYEYDD